MTTKQRSTEAAAAGIVPEIVLEEVRELVAPHDRLLNAKRALNIEARAAQQRLDAAKRVVSDLTPKVHLGEATREQLDAARRELAEAQLGIEGFEQAGFALVKRSLGELPKVDRAEGLIRAACAQLARTERARLEGEWSKFQRGLREQLERELAGLWNRHGEPLSRSTIRGIPLLANLAESMARASTAREVSVVTSRPDAPQETAA